jgi:branched-chain amino acid transport system permease protein
MSGYLSSIITVYCINLIIAYAVFLPASAGIINLGIAGFVAIGAYMSAYLNARYGLPLAITIPIAAVLSGLVGLLISVPLLRTRGVYMVLATFAFAEIVSGVLVNLEVVGGAAGYPVGGYLGLPAIFACTLGVIIFTIFIVETRFGLSIRSIHDDEPVAALFGVNVRGAKVAAFTAGAICGGLAGAIYAHHFNFIDVAYFNADMSIYVLLYVLIGGTQTPYGPIVGAAIFSFMPEILRGSEQWRYVIFAVMIIVIMALRPEGMVTRQLLSWRRSPADVPAGGASR